MSNFLEINLAKGEFTTDSTLWLHKDLIGKSTLLQIYSGRVQWAKRDGHVVRF